jgi:hypothetical protein
MPLRAVHIPLTLLFALIVLCDGAWALSDGEIQRGQEALTRLNLYRRMCGLPDVTLDLTMSEGCSLHAAYLNQNTDQVFGGLDAHDEYPDRPGYTEAGALAGTNGDIFYGGTGIGAIDGWFQTYYHRNPMMSPGVTKIGYGDNPGSNTGFSITVVQFEKYTGPGNYFSPGDRSDGNAIMGYELGETPQPVAGFGKNKGNPIIAYFAGQRVTWVSSKVIASGQELPHHVIAPNLPSNISFEVNEICLITEAPLPLNTQISVEIRYTQGSARVASWTFKTSPNGTFDAAVAVAAGAGTPSMDTDSDGFLDEIEIAAGTAFQNPSSTPFSGQPPGTPALLPLSALSIKLNFAVPASDLIKLSGQLPVPDGFDFSGQPVIVFVGGVARAFNLDSRGNAVIEGNMVRLTKPRNGMSRFNAKFSKGNFRASLQDEGLQNADLKAVLRNVTAIILFNQTLFLKDQPQVYSSKLNKFGRSK